MKNAIELIPIDVIRPLGVLGLGIITIHISFLILIFGIGKTSFYGVDYYFHLDAEYNIPSFYSCVILLYSAALLLKIHYINRTRSPDIYWILLSGIFLFLAADELLSFHEQWIVPIRSYFDLEGYFFFSWIIVGAVFATVVFIATIPFLRRLPKNVAQQFCVAGFLYLSGVIGMEMIGANEFYNSGFVYGRPSTIERGLIYAIIVTLEESLEILGILYFNYALTKHLKSLE